MGSRGGFTDECLQNGNDGFGAMRILPFVTGVAFYLDFKIPFRIYIFCTCFYFEFSIGGFGIAAMFDTGGRSSFSSFQVGIGVGMGLFFILPGFELSASGQADIALIFYTGGFGLAAIITLIGRIKLLFITIEMEIVFDLSFGLEQFEKMREAQVEDLLNAINEKRNALFG